MKRYFSMLLIAAGFIYPCDSYGFQSSQDKNLVLNPGFETIGRENLPENWTASFPRNEIAPLFRIDNTVSHTGKNSVLISGAGSRGTYGCLKTEIKGIRSMAKADFKPERTLPGSSFLGRTSYLIQCYYRTQDTEPEGNVRIKIAWTDKDGKELFSEFLPVQDSKDEWIKVSGIKTAPLNAVALGISLILQWTPEGKVWFDDVSVNEIQHPSERIVKIAASTDWSYSNSTTEKNLKYYSELVGKAGALGADIICLGEGITVAGTGKTYVDVSEPVPGKTSTILGEAAAKAGIYVVAGIYEREGPLVYNTALLIDPKGKIAGKYRKTHLPQAEVEAGLTPGDSYPVFRTEFGTIGIEICYDNFFPEVVRSLMLNGAEIIFCPIWGDIRGYFSEWFAVARARAIDNGVFFAASMYEKDGSLIIDPDGKILPDEGKTEGLILSTIDLSQRTFERWLSMKSYGEWKNLFLNERRPETYGATVK